MTDSAEYRKHAEECVRLAQTAKEHHRRLLLELAEKWLHLADRASADVSLIDPTSRRHTRSEELRQDLLPAAPLRQRRQS